MTNNKPVTMSRAQFEAANPVPFGVFWSEPDSRYMTTMVHLNCLEYQGKWLGWQSALLAGPSCSACNDTGRMHEDGCDPGDCSACTAPAVDRQVEAAAMQWQYESGSEWWAFDAENVGHNIESGTKIRLTDRAGNVLFQHPAPMPTDTALRRAGLFLSGMDERYTHCNEMKTLRRLIDIAQSPGRPVAVVTATEFRSDRTPLFTADIQALRPEALKIGDKVYLEKPLCAAPITMQSVMQACDSARHHYLQGTSNWCALVAQELNTGITSKPPIKGYCRDYQNCECGGDAEGVRATCDNWVKT